MELPSLTVRRVDGSAVAGGAGLPIKYIAFPDAGGMQATDATGTVLTFETSSGGGSLIPAANNASDLGAITPSLKQWRAGFFGTTVSTPALSTVVAGVSQAVATLNSAASAVNGLALTSTVTTGVPSIVAVGADTNVSLRFAPQLAANILLDGGATGGVSVGVNGTSKVGLYAATPVVRAGAIAAPATQGVAYVQADVQSIVTAVNAIRVALTNIGVTL